MLEVDPEETATLPFRTRDRVQMVDDPTTPGTQKAEVTPGDPLEATFTVRRELDYETVSSYFLLSSRVGPEVAFDEADLTLRRTQDLLIARGLVSIDGLVNKRNGQAFTAANWRQIPHWLSRQMVVKLREIALDGYKETIESDPNSSVPFATS